MRNETWEKLDSQLAEFPILRGKSALETEIDAASKSLGKVFPADYRDFLVRYGGAIVGPYPVFGVQPVPPMGNMWSVVAVNEHYRADAWPGIDDWLIISRDHAGNPIGLTEGDEVWISDHGQAYRIAGSFEEFLLNECLSQY